MADSKINSAGPITHFLIRIGARHSPTKSEEEKRKKKVQNPAFPR
jgi:hypothetical protein